MSASGLPSTAITSANFPGASEPMRSCQPRSSAASTVAARMHSSGVNPIPASAMSSCALVPCVSASAES